MGRMQRTVIEIMGITLVFMIISYGVYFIGVNFAKSFLMANQSISIWRNQYVHMVQLIGGISWAMSLLWYFLARFLFTVNAPFYEGKRTTWGILFVVNIVIGIGVLETVFAQMAKSAGLSAMAIGCLCIGGYYVATVFGTPRAYKYTPVGAGLLRGRKRARHQA